MQKPEGGLCAPQSPVLAFTHHALRFSPLSSVLLPRAHDRLPRLPTGIPGQRAQPQRTGIPLALPPWLRAVLNFVSQPRRGFSPGD